MAGCFLAVRTGSPSWLIPVSLAWKFHAEKYRIMDPPKEAPTIQEPVRLDSLDLSKGAVAVSGLPAKIDELHTVTAPTLPTKAKKGRGGVRKKSARKGKTGP